MKYVFVDFEMNEIDRKYRKIRRECANEIVQIGAVMLDEELNEIGEFREYARPVYNDCISGGCAQVTEITYENVAEAKPIEEVYAAFADWCAGLAGNRGYRIFAWSENDLTQLLNEMKIKDFGADHPETEWILDNWIDYQQEYSDLIGCRSALSLSTARRLRRHEIQRPPARRPLGRPQHRPHISDSPGRRTVRKTYRAPDRSL